MRSLAVSLGLILCAASLWAQSPGQPPVEACKPGDFTVIGFPNEFGPKLDGQFVVRTQDGFVDQFLTRESIWIPSIDSSIARWNGISGSTWFFDNRGITEEFADFEDGEVTISPCGGFFACPPEPPVLPPGPPVPDFADTLPAHNTVIAVTLISSDGGSGSNIGDSDIFFDGYPVDSGSPKM